jgi:hypothetical protein
LRDDRIGGYRPPPHHRKRRSENVKRYLSRTPRKEYPKGVRLVHNFPPGPPDDPGADRAIGFGGFRIWVTDEEESGGSRCYCGWLEDREHYGGRAFIDAEGKWVDRAALLAARQDTA